MGASVKDIHFQLNREVQYHQLGYSVFVNVQRLVFFEAVIVVGASLSGKPVIASIM